MEKKLYKNKDEGMFTGVLAGFSEYLSLEVTLVRILYILFVLITGFFPGILLYIVAMFVMPETPKIEPLSKEEYVVYD